MSLNKVYFYKKSFKEYDIKIDGEVYYYMDVVLSGFPFSKKIFYFYRDIKDDIKCYPIKYVEVVFLFSKRVYVYDLN